MSDNRSESELEVSEFGDLYIVGGVAINSLGIAVINAIGGHEYSPEVVYKCGLRVNIPNKEA